MSPIDSPRCSFAKIQTLSTELRVLILCNSSDVCSFKNLILSCSAFYQAYRSARKPILLSLARHLYSNDGIPLQLPYLAAIKAASIKLFAIDGVRSVARFLDQSSEVDEDFTHEISADHCIQLLSLHRDVTLICKDLCTWSLSRRLQREGGQQPQNEQSTSKSERRRIIRAIYRWELWSQLFKPRSVDFNGQLQRLSIKRTPPKAKDQVSLFLARYPVYEQEQLACLCDYAMRRYMALFDGIKVHSAKIREQQQEEQQQEQQQQPPLAAKQGIDRNSFPTSASFFDTTNDSNRDKRRDNIISYGPSVLAHVLRSAGDLEHQAKIILMNDIDSLDEPTFPQLMVRNYADEAADPLRKAKEGLLVADKAEEGGEEEEEGEGETLPYGWLWAREKIIAEGPFPWLSHEYLVPWGYVFWDKSRFQDWEFLIGGGLYQYFDEDPGVDDSDCYGICERATGEPLEYDRNIFALFAETIEFMGRNIEI